MAGIRDCLMDIFDDLDNTEFEKFQWQLRIEGSVKKAKLDDANRMKTIDAMVGSYNDDQVLEVTRRILEKIQRNDLAKKIPGSGSGSNGSAATPCQPKTPTESAVPTESAMKKLKSVRGAFIEGMSQANLHALLDKLLDRDVINDDEMEEIRSEKLKKDKARRIIDMVKVKGDGPSADMIDAVRQLDANFCQNIGL